MLQYIWENFCLEGRGQYLTTCHELIRKSQSGKGRLVALNFFLLGIQLATAHHELLKKSQPCKSCIVALEFFLLEILLRTLDVVVLEESCLVLRFPKKIKNVIKITGMFFICLILHVLSGKYFEESFGAFFKLKFPSNAGTNFCFF